MWSEHERPGRTTAWSCLMYSSSVSASLECMILLKTLLVMRSRVMPLQLGHSPKLPFLGNLIRSPVFHASGIILFSLISQKMYIKRCYVSVPSAFSISGVTPSAPAAFQLCIVHGFDGSFHLFHGRWLYTDSQVLYCRGNLRYLRRFCLN